MKCIHRLKSPDDALTIYQFAHLVEIYQAYSPAKIHFYDQNKWIQQYLPHFPLQQSIFLDITLKDGKTPFKKYIEKGLSGKIGTAIEKIISWITIPILLCKKKFLSRRKYLSILPYQIWHDQEDLRVSTSILWKMLVK